MTVIWLLGNFCPYKCTYCSPDYNDGSKSYHSLDNIKFILSQLPEKSDIVFSGGEPTYHPDFEDILDIPTSHRLGVISNGARPIAFWERVIPKLSPIILTFHNEFAKLDRFIETAQLCKPKLSRVNLTMIPWLWEESIRAYETFIDKNIPVTTKPLVKNFGYKSESLVDEYLPHQIEWLNNRKTGTEIKWIGLYNSDNELIEKTNPSEMLSNSNTNFFNWECYTPTNTLHINASGDIFNTACRQKELVGTIFTGIKIKTDPIICKQNFCWCHPDISATKIRK
jgi:pyruvate-formate lyase-activating enzyme